MVDYGIWWRCGDTFTGGGVDIFPTCNLYSRNNIAHFYVEGYVGLCRK